LGSAGFPPIIKFLVVGGATFAIVPSSADPLSELAACANDIDTIEEQVERTRRQTHEKIS
jgi:hypothetical protein